MNGVRRLHWRRPSVSRIMVICGCGGDYSTSIDRAQPCAYEVTVTVYQLESDYGAESRVSSNRSPTRISKVTDVPAVTSKAAVALVKSNRQGGIDLRILATHWCSSRKMTSIGKRMK